jgi:hypothetical protein
MARLFGHRDHGGVDSATALQQIQAEAERLAALTLPQLAAEVMHTAFSSDFVPDLSPVLPSQWTLVPDDLAEHDLDIPADLGARLRDLAAEGAQFLEHKSLIRPEAHYSGATLSHGYLTTRAGRTALIDGTLDQILTGP